MKYLRENDYFETSDISLASSIYYFTGKLEALNKTIPSKTVFIFRRDKELDSLVQSFWSHTLTVDPLAYFGCLKELKTRLYQNIN
jgi:hypothetical protein